MRKKFITMITVCMTAILLLSVTASAYYLTGKCGKNLEYGLDIGSLQIDIWGNGDMQNFNLSNKTEMNDRWGGISGSIQKVDIDEGVTSIGNHAFAVCELLRSVKLPNTLMSIGEDAFGNCSNLEKIEIPEGTKEIGDFAFLMSALKDITIPSTLTKIGLSAFDSNNDLNIHISDITAWCNVERFGFRGNANNIKTNLYIGDKPATNITIPNGTKRITGGAFWIMSNIKSITIPKSVTEIEEYAFNESITLNVYENSYAHKYAVQNSIPYNIMSYPNTNGNSITISNSQKNNDTVSFTAKLSSSEEIQGTIFAAVYDTNGAITNIKSYHAAANNDISITKKDNDYTAKIFWWFDTDSMYPMSDYAEIKLNEVEKAYSINKDYDNTRGSVTVTENGQEITTAAEGKQITIGISPKSGYGVLSTAVTDTSGNIIEIKNNTFTMPKDDVNITVTFVGTRDSGTFGINNNLTWLLDDNGTLTISGSGQMEDFTSSNTPWNTYNSDIKIVVIKNGVTRISKNAFADCSKMKRVLIDKSITEIEAAAFRNCADLSTVEYSGSQSDWENVYIGSDNEQLKNANFIYNSSLSDTAQTDLDYLKYTQNENNTITITNCLADAVEINIPKEIGGLPVTTIGENAFSGCGGLTSVTIPDSVTSISDYAFSSCPLTNVIIPDSVTNLGIGIFSGCSDIKTAVIGNGVINISELTFSGCSGLTSIIIPDGVNAVGGQAFYDCGGLADIKIGNSVTNIGDSAFSGCSSLTNITIPNSVTNIGGSAFSDCSGLKDVYISDMAAWCNIEFGNASANPMYYANKLYVNNELLTNLVIPDSVTSIRDYTFYNCTGLTSVTLPYSVTSIGNAAFYNCTGLTNTTIGNSVTRIGYSAFSGCGGLTSITIPDSVTSIGSGVFYNCNGLTSVTIGNGLTSVDENAFQNCSNLDSVYLLDLAVYLNIEFENEYSNPMYYANKLYLNNKRVTSVEIPDGVTKIPDYAFYGCDSITNITIPDSVTNIGENAFNGTAHYNNNDNWENEILYINNHLIKFNSTISAYEIKEGTKTIASNAFYDCRSLTDITIPNSVKSIGNSAFYNCSKLNSVYITDLAAYLNTEFGNEYSNPVRYANHLYLHNEPIKGDIVIPEGVTNIPSSAFCGCSNLTSVTLPNSVRNISDKAFDGCSGLTSITIPDSVTSIGYSAFENCSHLTSITIPDSVTSIGNYAFCGCSGLTSVNIMDLTAWCNVSANTNSDLLRYAKKLFVNESLVTELVIPNGVTSIGTAAFSKCKCITSVIIPDSVTSIGSGAFSDCSDLKDVYISDMAAWCNIEFGNVSSNPMSCASNMYLNNSLVTSVDIPDSVTSIRDYTFYNCTGLTSITIPDGITSIGRSTFYGCSGLTSVIIPDSVTSIGNSAFYNCSGLTSVTISNSVTSIGNHTFGSCSSLTSITIPNSITMISGGMFSDCSSLTSVTIPNTVTSIAYNAFDGCSGLTSVIIPKSVTSMEQAIFKGCTKLTSITIPDGVKSIDASMFNGCSGLTSIIIPKSVTSIGLSAFAGCSKLKTVYYTGSQTEWNKIDINDNSFNNSGNNDYLKKAIKTYNYVPKE